MMHLQRASAGSGKTFALAKTFIRLFISKRQGDKRVLRNAKELPHSLTHILAVTFTNKATNEMKQRIVEKLAALASADTAPEPSKIDYLDDFVKEFSVTAKDIAEISRKALDTLLLNYSDFHVSTIDSFFQNILHTFTYETDIDDSFNLEIDSDYVAAVGLDSLLETMTTARKGNDSETLHWLKYLMNDKRKTTRWNIFRKENKEKSLYNELIGKIKELEKEDFKINIREELYDYFERGSRPLSSVVHEVDSYFIGELKRLYDARMSAATDLEQAYNDENIDIAAQGAAYQAGRIRKSKLPFDSENIQTFNASIRNPSDPGHSLAKSKFPKKGFPPADIDVERLDRLNVNFVEANDCLNEFLTSADYRTWKVYKKLLPYLPLLHVVAKKKKEYLDSTNTIEISDTNSFLSRIIGEDETPFIYERMGTRINHYLIDEFQDTSSMQWNNFLPLLRESEDRGMDNLIIGDAKQSIYRFRNADYRIIANEVTRMFGSNLIETADDILPPKEKINTNWRSNLNIVQFNNFVFHFLSQMHIEEGGETLWLFGDEIRKIYADCIQTPHAKEKRGYVEVTLYEPGSAGDEEEEEGISPGYAALGDLILRLHAKGYAFKDIGILTRTKVSGAKVVETLMNFNAEHEDSPGEFIPFISDQNLLIGAAPPVKLIVRLLEIAAMGPQDDMPEKSANAPVEEIVDTARLFEEIKGMKAYALSAIVELIIGNFLPRAYKRDFTAHIAAFQDVVLDYCSSHPSDLVSFLQWWKKKAGSLAIFSSDESEAVRVLTIHKAKGLEYKCVIVPEADYLFSGSRKPEWAWVPQALSQFPDLPAHLPVETSTSLIDTHHEDVWERYSQNVALDSLNAVYVAFTRAVNELYVYAPVEKSKETKKKKEGGLASRLGDNLKRLFAESRALVEASELPYLIEDPFIVSSPREEGLPAVFTYGEPLTAEEVETSYRKAEKRKKREEDDEIKIEDYKVSYAQTDPIFKDEKMSVGEIFESAEDPEYSNVRSDAVLLHGILELVSREEDLPRALLKYRSRGIISREQEGRFHRQLTEALASVKNYGWFSGRYDVMNERTILSRRNGERRPDRIMVSPEGEAIVVDYKFGHHTEVAKYVRQVKNYMRLLSDTGLFSSVKGYLWYVAENKITEVTL